MAADISGRTFKTSAASATGSLPRLSVEGEATQIPAPRSLNNGGGKSILPALSSFTTNKLTERAIRVKAQIAFNAADNDKSGDLDRLEFKKYLSKTAKGANLDARTLRATSKAEFATADADNSRRVEFNEFFAYFKAHQHELKMVETDEDDTPVWTAEDFRSAAVPTKKPKHKRPKTAPEKSLSDYLSTGNLEGLKHWLEYNPTATKDESWQMSLAGIPAIVIAAHYDQLKIVEYLVSRRDLDNTMNDVHRKHVLKACEDEDAERVKTILDNVYAEAVQRCSLMDAFVSGDIDAAKDNLKQSKNKRRVVKRTSCEWNAEKNKPSTSEVAYKGVRKLDKPLFAAAARGDVLAARQALSRGGNIHALDEHNVTPLLHACVYGLPEMVDCLLKYGANPIHIDLYRRTAMTIVAKRENTACIKLLIQYGGAPSLYISDSLSKIPIEQCKSQYTKEHIRQFMREQPAKSFSEAQRDPKNFKFSMQKQTDSVFHKTNRGVHFGADQLCQAAHDGDLDYIRNRLEFKEDMNVRGRFGMTPLMHACSQGRLDIIKLIIKNGQVPMNDKSMLGNTILHFAYDCGDKEVIAYLLQQNGVRKLKNVRNKDRMIPSQCARSR